MDTITPLLTAIDEAAENSPEQIALLQELREKMRTVPATIVIITRTNYEGALTMPFTSTDEAYEWLREQIGADEEEGDEDFVADGDLLQAVNERTDSEYDWDEVPVFS